MSEITITIDKEEQKEVKEIKEIVDTMSKEEKLRFKGFLEGLRYSGASIRE